MEIAINNEQQKSTLPKGFEQLLQQCVRLACQKERLPENYEVGITIVDDDTIGTLNRDYRNIDAPTDVLSFALLEKTEEEPQIHLDGGDETLLLGDIIISAEAVERQAEEYGHSLTRELCFLTVHGMLHLLGYDHDTAEAEETMEARQEEILAEINVSR